MAVTFPEYRMELGGMPVLKVMGIETEYGIALRNRDATSQTKQDFFRTVCDEAISWDYITESPAKDARGISYLGATLSPQESDTVLSQTQIQRSDDDEIVDQPPVSLSIEKGLSTVLPNGA